MTWLDPAGFEVGERSRGPASRRGLTIGHDHVITNDQFGVRMTRTF